MPNSLIPDFPITTAETPGCNLCKSDTAPPFRGVVDAMDKAGVALGDVSTQLCRGRRRGGRP